MSILGDIYGGLNRFANSPLGQNIIRYGQTPEERRLDMLAEERRREVEERNRAIETAKAQQIIRETVLGDLSERPEAYDAAKLMKYGFSKDDIGVLLGAPSADSPSNVREWQYYSALPDDQKRQFLEMKRASPIKDFGGYIGAVNPLNNQVENIGDKSVPPESTPDHKASVVSAEASARREQELIHNKPKDDLALKLARKKKALISNMIDDAIGMIGVNTTGLLGTIARNLPIASEASDLEATLGSIKANLGFNQLQAMKEASDKGGSGLGNVAIPELDALQSVLGSIKVDGQRPERLKENLETIKNHITTWHQVVEDDYAKRYGVEIDDGWEIVE